jgi:hypothetical protein
MPSWGGWFSWRGGSRGAFAKHSWDYAAEPQSRADADEQHGRGYHDQLLFAFFLSARFGGRSVRFAHYTSPFLGNRAWDALAALFSALNRHFSVNSGFLAKAIPAFVVIMRGIPGPTLR